MKKLLIIPILIAMVPSMLKAQPITPEQADMRSFSTTQNGIDQKLGAIVPLDAEFTDESGKKVKLRQFFKSGKPVIISPVWFECQGTCLLTFDGLLKSFAAMKADQPGKGFEVINFSIKPTETVAMANDRKQSVLSIYNKPGVPEGWHFLVGDLDNIRKLTAAIGYRYTYNQTLDKINHPSGIVIATPEGMISNYMYGVEYPAKTLKLYLDKAKGGGVASQPAPVILLGCMQYDPGTGQIRLIAWRAVQIGGIITVLTLFGTIGFLSIKYRQQPTVRKSRKGGANESN